MRGEREEEREEDYRGDALPLIPPDCPENLGVDVCVYRRVRERVTVEERKEREERRERNPGKKREKPEK